MAVMQRTTTLTAGSVVENVLTGSAFEFARGNQLLSMGITQDTTAGGSAAVTIQVGSDIVLEESVPIEKTTYPIIPDEFFYSDAAVSGDRIVIRVRETGGASPVTVRTVVQVANV